MAAFIGVTLQQYIGAEHGTFGLCVLSSRESTRLFWCGGPQPHLSSATGAIASSCAAGPRLPGQLW